MLLRFLSLLLLVTYVQQSSAASKGKDWWKDTFIYQVYVRSFMDSDGDGVGDLNGIKNKLDHFVDLNVSAICLSPIYVSPMEDFGYDIANFTDVDPVFGTISDFANLTAAAKALGLRVILDLVPNHTSEKHPWFLNSVKRLMPYTDYYVWMDGKLVNGTTYPPNNWLSVHGGSAWKFNEERGQYYLHQFSVDKPDLNYRSASLMLEMEAVLNFWLGNGVDGFRINSANYLYEDAEYLDEPRRYRPNLSADDYETLDHIYSKDQPETYALMKTWRKLLDAHSKKDKEPKILITEAETTLPLTMDYFDAGVNVPVNFMLVDELDNESSTLEFKRSIDAWLNSVPKGNSPNWLIGNQDRHRVASRLGSKRADELLMLTAVLPGVGIIYYGDEIGMEDRNMTWQETVDPVGCSAGGEKYQLRSRDPERTPYQWDNSTNAGFSDANATWLPVHPNYKEVNLEKQKQEVHSHYSLFRKLVQLKKTLGAETPSTEVILVGYEVLGIVRRLPDTPPVVLLINFSNKTVVIDAKTWMNIPEELTVFASSVGSEIPSGVMMDTTEVNLPTAASVILTA